MPRNPAIFAKQTGFILYISHPAGILAPSFKSTRIQHEIICKSLIPGPSRLDPDLTGLLGSPGCTIVQPLDMEVGAGTSHPMTCLRALGPEPMATAYVQPSRRPTDGRYGENPNRLQHYYQFRGD